MSYAFEPEKGEDEIRPASGHYGVAADCEMRLDVEDNHERYPQGLASGRFVHETSGELYWVANKLQQMDGYRNYWRGKLCYLNPGVPRFPIGTWVHIWLTRYPSTFGGISGHAAHIGFSADHSNNVVGLPVQVMGLPHQSRRFRKINLVFAIEDGEDLEYSIERGDERLTIPQVFEEAGFEVTETIIEPRVGHPFDPAAKAPKTWTHEKLDAVMRSHWEQNPLAAQRGIWVFCGSSYWRGWRGVMFDSRGSRFRQGCATFRNDEPFEQGEQFRVVCHEIGHCFNLPHSDVRMRDVPGFEPWFDKDPDATAMTFMRNPDVGMTDDELTRFGYLFSGHELTFLRHAPEALVYPSGVRYLYTTDQLQVTAVASETGVEIEVGAAEMGCSKTLTRKTMNL